jgi:hypothetical protein
MRKRNEKDQKALVKDECRNMFCIGHPVYMYVDNILAGCSVVKLLNPVAVKPAHMN